MAACVSNCKTLTQTQLCCRGQHAVTLSNLANRMQTDLDTHCPHIIGKSPCT
jgi:hypothetical protein